MLLDSEKQFAPAQEEFELADSLRPRTFEILHNLGQAYLRNGSPAKVERAFERALALRPDSAETTVLLSQASETGKQFLQLTSALMDQDN